MTLTKIQKQLTELLSEFEQYVQLKPKQIFVIGCSTSEVLGSKIGTNGALEVAEALYLVFERFAKKHNIYLAFQGCEHINRAITVEYEVLEKYNLEQVSVIPVQKAGGSMAAYAYKKFKNPVVVENIRAHAGIDIGQTLIGMHLKEVAVPIRTSIRQVGEAVVTIATTRPKLIGGERAIYKELTDKMC